MKDLKTNFFNQFKKGGLFYKAALVSIFTTLLIMVVALIKFLVSPKVGDFSDIFFRFLFTFFGSFIALFLFFTVYIYFNPDFFDPDNKDQ